MHDRPPFHLAFPVLDLAATRDFFTGVLGCRVGREDQCWIDFDCSGHQITVHLSDVVQPVPTNRVDGKPVPVRHFGLVLEWQQWRAVAERLRHQGVAFLIEPCLRFAGQVGEQATLFILDPSGNAIELKSFRDPSALLQRRSAADTQRR